MLSPFAVSTVTYHTESLDAALDGIVAAGFRHVELGAIPGMGPHVSPGLSESMLAALDAQIARRDLQVVSVSGHSDLTTAAGVEYCRRIIEFASARGVPIVNTAIGGHAGIDEDEESFMTAIGPLCDLAAAHSVILALEVHGEIMASGEKSARLFERIGQPALRLNYDTANCVYYGGVEPYDDLEACVGLVGHVHLKDTAGGRGVWDFPAIGDGNIDFTRVLRILDRHGYEGPLSVEIEFTPDGAPSREGIDQAVARSYDTLAAVRDELDA